MTDWQEEAALSITVCDRAGKILYMNKKARGTFRKTRGGTLIGSNVLACHPEPARARLAAMLKNPFTNAYTIKKNGVKKLIFQTPWFGNGRYRGLAELSLELPEKLPHFDRK